MLYLFPHVQNITYLDGYFDKTLIKSINLGTISNQIFIKELNNLIKDINFNKINADINFLYDEDLACDHYLIKIKDQKINIYYKLDNMAYYALQTLKQILNHQEINNCEIEDYPNLQIRGLMIDISRDKVPTLNTLTKLVDDMVYLKMNHLELYVEGFSFEYKSFKELIDIDRNYITIEEYLSLEAYCNERYIDLVPNQNGFGHMGPWIGDKSSPYHNLAECVDGATYWGSLRPPATLDPYNIESFNLVKKMYQDMLPLFKSKYFNMNFDEPMELGMGKSKTIVEEKGIQNVYLEFLDKCVNEVKSYNKIPMCWGDVLIKHSDTLSKIPKDLIFLDWGYDHKYDFETHASMLEENHIKFMMAPGTSTWASITGKYIDMYQSIENATQACIKHHGLGVLTTDWGDFGHLQYLPFSYIGFIFGLCKSWSTIEENEISKALSMYFKPHQVYCIKELSHIHELEGPFPSYGSRMFTPIMYASLVEQSLAYTDKELISDEYILNSFKNKLKYQQIDSFNQNLLNKTLDKISSNIDIFSEDLVDQEILNSIYLLKTLISINHHLLSDTGDLYQDIKNLENYSMRHFDLWCARNKKEGYKLSNNKITNLIHMLLKDIKRRENI